MTEKRLTEKDFTEMNLDEHFDALDAILAEMESENVEFERSFELYQEGLKHVRAANDAIEDIEKKLLILNDDGKLLEEI
jgi:exodeoxyribonuclease VII small subunit